MIFRGGEDLGGFGGLLRIWGPEFYWVLGFGLAAEVNVLKMLKYRIKKNDVITR